MTCLHMTIDPFPHAPHTPLTTEEGTLQLGNIQYVQQEEGESGAQVARWARGWRSLRARSQAKMLPLVVRDDE